MLAVLKERTYTDVSVQDGHAGLCRGLTASETNGIDSEFAVESDGSVSRRTGYSVLQTLPSVLAPSESDSRGVLTMTAGEKRDCDQTSTGK